MGRQQRDAVRVRPVGDRPDCRANAWLNALVFALMFFADPDGNALGAMQYDAAAE